MAAHLKMTYKKGHLMVMWVSRHPHTLSFLEGERMRSISVYRNTQPFRWLQWELGAALVSELLITHIWKPLHRFSMERSGLEEADSNKLATFSKKKKALSHSSKPKMLVGLLRKDGTKTQHTDWKRQHRNHLTRVLGLKYRNDTVPFIQNP